RVVNFACKRQVGNDLQTRHKVQIVDNHNVERIAHGHQETSVVDLIGHHAVAPLVMLGHELEGFRVHRGVREVHVRNAYGFFEDFAYGRGRNASHLDEHFAQKSACLPFPFEGDLELLV